MKSLPKARSPLTHHGWKKALGLAALFVACEPMTPSVATVNCDNLPACSALDYGFYIESKAFAEQALQDSLGAVLIDSPGFRILVTERFASTPVACPQSGRSGYAFASSCLPCKGEALRLDSLYFTTDIGAVAVAGNTLPAGYNFAADPLPPGFLRFASGFQIMNGFPIKFRDSIFEIRFTGFADSAKKFGAITVRITNPALLLSEP